MKHISCLAYLFILAYYLQCVFSNSYLVFKEKDYILLRLYFFNSSLKR